MNHQGDTRQSCVCYIANEGYLFQTLTSALQAKRLAGSAFDIVLVNLTAHPTSETDIVAGICEKNNIVFITMAPTFLENLPFVYSRMFIDEFLPDRYLDILYMDGDTQIIKDISPLLRMPLRPGFICGARDPMVFLNKAGALPDNLKAEIKKFGDDYINAGILRFDRATWSSLSKEALALKYASTSKPTFEDQTVINTVAQHRIEFASISWNFPGFILGYGFEEHFTPKVVHFMSDPRPWEGAYAPWGRKWAAPYDDLLQTYPSLHGIQSHYSFPKSLAYKVKQIVKSARERRIWRDGRLIESMLTLNQSTSI
jgi:lipopolysaccharide biosynthesis glycosyltransferase